MSLPVGWVEYPDPATGNPYFHNAASGETTWTRPVDAAPQQQMFQQPQQPQLQQQMFQQPPQALPPGWVEFKDPSTGNPYFHCAATNETTWTRPINMGGMGASFSAPAGGMMGNVPQGLIAGICKNWDEEKGFGFIDPVAGGDNVFVHRSALADGMMLLKGANVQYELTFNPQKGKAQVSKCLGAVGGAGGAPVMEAAMPTMQPNDGAQASGTVKTWFDDKGFGFVTPGDGSKDCYVHRTFLLDGQSLVVGSTVQYTIQFDPVKNKNNATKVTGGVPGDPNTMGGAGKGMAKGMAPMGMPMNSFGSDSFGPVTGAGFQPVGPYGAPGMV